MSKYFEKMLDSTMHLLSINSVEDKPCDISPFGKGVGTCLQYVEEIASKMGFKCHNEEGYYLTCDIGQGKEFGILGHVDVVPFDDDWDANPLGEIKGDVIFGRGILDDKGPMMSCLYATYELLQEGYTPKRQIRFIFGGNEETGWRCIDRYMQVDKMPEDGFSPDGDFPVINCEKGIAHFVISLPMPQGMIYAKGGSRANIVMGDFEVKIKGFLKIASTDTMKVSYENGITIIKAVGIPAHGSTPALGVNAGWEVLKALSKSIGGEYTFLADRFCHYDGSGFGAVLKDEKSGEITFNLGKVDTYTENDINMLQLTLDVRIPVDYDIDYVKALISAQLIGTKVEVEHSQNPLYVDPKSELVSSLLDVYNEEMNTNLEPIAIGGGTYARALKNGVAFGPMFPDQESTIHQKNERVEIALFKKMYEIYKKAIRKLCFN